MNGDRRPRRRSKGGAGLASAQFRLASPQMLRAEARGVSLKRQGILKEEE